MGSSPGFTALVANSGLSLTGRGGVCLIVAQEIELGAPLVLWFWDGRYEVASLRNQMPMVGQLARCQG